MNNTAEDAALLHFAQAPSNPYRSEWTRQLLAITFAYDPRRFQPFLDMHTFKLLPFDSKNSSSVSISDQFQKYLDAPPTAFPTDITTLSDDKWLEWRKYHRIYEAMAISCILTVCDYSGWFPVEAMLARRAGGEECVYWKDGAPSWTGGAYGNMEGLAEKVSAI